MAHKESTNMISTEMHTAGEPLRIIEGGLPPLQGKSILEKLKYFRENLDHFRRFFIFEPRGHRDMYGAILVPSDIPEADIGAIFMDNKGYSSMCGHAVIALSRYIVDKGFVGNPTSPETKVCIQCPCGPVVGHVKYDDISGRTGAVRFQSVPAFVFLTENKMTSEVIRVKTTEMHTGGEPLRIVEEGYPPLQGKTILEKIKFARENLDHYRRLVIYEPRGHFDMFGVLQVAPDIPEADVGVIFIHNEGYSIMCGHGVIALGRYFVDNKLVKNPSSPETKIGVQCPCGLVDVYVQYDSTTGKTGAVRFHSVPSFVFATDVSVHVEGFGEITVDIVYGGAFFAFTSVKSYGYDLKTTSVQKLKEAAGATTEALKGILSLEHPYSSDLAFLYGTLLTDGNDQFSDEPTAHFCVFADMEVDRSPCGSGTTARVALQYYKGYLKVGQRRKFQSPVGSIFEAGVVKEVTYGKYKNAVIVEVSGQAYYTGSSVFTLEEDDAIGKGFLLR